MKEKNCTNFAPPKKKNFFDPETEYTFQDSSFVSFLPLFFAEVPKNFGFQVLFSQTETVVISPGPAPNTSNKLLRFVWILVLVFLTLSLPINVDYPSYLVYLLRAHNLSWSYDHSLFR